MDKRVDVIIPVDAEAARALASPARREAVGRYLSALLRDGRIGEVLAEAKREARANGLADEDIDAEIEAWRAERQA